MKRLLFLIIAAASLWGGYWFVGSRAATAKFEHWFEARRLDGWVAETGDITTRGFPNRFDTTIRELDLADPRTGLAYRAPFLQVFRLSYKPNHLIAAWPHDQTLATPYGKLAIVSSDMRASLVVDGTDGATLERSNLAISDLEVTAQDGRRGGAQRLLMAVEAAHTDQNTYHFGVEATDLVLPQPAGLRLEAGHGLPNTLKRAHADLSVAFDKPWDLNALQQARPQPTRINVKEIKATWGQLDLRVAGSLDVKDGVPAGRITVKAQNWRDISALGVASGVIPEALRGPIEQGGALLSGLSGNRNTLDVPLDFSGGRVMLGPIPLGPAPRLVLR